MRRRAVSEAAMESFNVNELSAIPTFKERLEYCKAKLGPALNQGSARVIFEIDDDKVLKLARNQKGIAQNDFEIDASNMYYCVVKVFDYSDDYSWVIEENAITCKSKKDFDTDLKIYLGISYDEFEDFVLSCSTINVENVEKVKEINRLRYNYAFLDSLASFIIDNNITYTYDYTRFSTYGLVERDGESQIVLLDAGVNDEILKTLYFHDVKEADESDVDIDSFSVKKELNRNFWKGDKLNPQIRKKLLVIARDFLEDMCIDWIKPKDVIMTGSLANYNWSNDYSDIDLHIVLDTTKLSDKKDFVERYFKYTRGEWNTEHEDIKICGFPVEVYVQDVKEEHNATGMYSLLFDKWISKPDIKKLNNGDFDADKVTKKAMEFMDEIDALCDNMETFPLEDKEYEKLFNKAQSLMDKIKDYRRFGKREKGFEMSEENIVFKVLRRNGYIEKLKDFKKTCYDKSRSL